MNRCNESKLITDIAFVVSVRVECDQRVCYGMIDVMNGGVVLGFRLLRIWRKTQIYVIHIAASEQKELGLFIPYVIRPAIFFYPVAILFTSTEEKLDKDSYINVLHLTSLFINSSKNNNQLCLTPKYTNTSKFYGQCGKRGLMSSNIMTTSRWRVFGLTLI